MKRVIAVANQKGGVGKTTTAVNLAASLAATKRRVMLIDLDPQGNATMGSGVDKSQLQASSCDVLLGEADLTASLLRVDPGGYALLPSNQDLTAAEVRLLTMMAGRETKLRNALAGVRDSFDVILIDCPPALNMLTVNSLVAADSVLIPMQCEYYALEGLSALVGTIEQIRDAANEKLEIEGILRTMFDPRNNLANEVSAQLIMHFGDKVFRTIIPRNIRLAEAPSFGRPVLFHDKESRGALAYLALAGEMIRREEEELAQAAAAAAAGENAAAAGTAAVVAASGVGGAAVGTGGADSAAVEAGSGAGAADATAPTAATDTEATQVSPANPQTSAAGSSDQRPSSEQTPQPEDAANDDTSPSADATPVAHHHTAHSDS